MLRRHGAVAGLVLCLGCCGSGRWPSTGDGNVAAWIQGLQRLAAEALEREGEFLSDDDCGAGLARAVLAGPPSIVRENGWYSWHTRQASITLDIEDRRSLFAPGRRARPGRLRVRVIRVVVKGAQAAATRPARPGPRHDGQGSASIRKMLGIRKELHLYVGRRVEIEYGPDGEVTARRVIDQPTVLDME